MLSLCASVCCALRRCLQVAPWLAPLDRDLVKLILRLLKSPAFLGTAQLLAAIASTDANAAAATGLLKVGGAGGGWAQARAACGT